LHLIYTLGKLFNIYVSTNVFKYKHLNDGCHKNIIIKEQINEYVIYLAKRELIYLVD